MWNQINVRCWRYDKVEKRSGRKLTLMQGDAHMLSPGPSLYFLP